MSLRHPICEPGSCRYCDEVRDARAVLRFAAKRVLVALLLALAAFSVVWLASCGPTPAPKPPQAPRWNLTVKTEPSASVRILDGPDALTRATADASGWVVLVGLRQAGFTVCSTAVGYRENCAGVTLTHAQDVKLPLARSAPAFAGRLRATPAGFVDPVGRPVVWRGITAFGLLEQVAHGREAEAIAWMDARASEGFTVLRVLTMCRGWLELSPEDGRRALPRLLALAQERGLYVLAVALAATDTRPRAFLDEQVRAVGQACFAADSCLLEIANEPYHGSQHPALYSPKTMAKLRALVPGSVPVAYGAPRSDEMLSSAAQVEGVWNDGRFMCGGDFNALHRARRAETWDNARRFTELAKVAKACGKFTVDDEPKGFAEVPQIGTNERETRSEAGFGQGSLARLFGLGTTFHCESCLLSTPLGPKQTAAAAEFIAGTRIVPDGMTFRWANAKAGDSAVKDASLIGPSNPNAAVQRIFSFFGAQNLIALVGLRDGRDPAIQWQGGWKQGAVRVTRPGFQVWELAR